jgi:hypothetical protein
MTTTALAVFVFIAFLVPIPLLHWLDLPRRPADGEPGPEASE